MNMTCPICGGELKEHVSGCAKCPVSGNCDMLCCDDCGYETVAPKSAVVDFFKRVFGQKEKDDGASRVS